MKYWVLIVVPGGQQWVSEICFPTGTLSKPTMKDLNYMENLLQLIEKEDIPAPAPIEQRWTARSKSPMSPASSSEEQDIFSWVGIMMYLPTSDATEEGNYRGLLQLQERDTNKSLGQVFCIQTLGQNRGSEGQG